MEALEVLKVSIKEWILVVPLEFGCNSIPPLARAIKDANVIELVRDRFARLVVNCLSDRKRFFDPSLHSQAISKTLGAFGFAPAGPYNLLNRYRLSKYDLLEFGRSVRKVYCRIARA
jgi:hypothetical protein